MTIAVRAKVNQPSLLLTAGVSQDPPLIKLSFLLTIRTALYVPHSCVPTSTNLADDPPIILEQLINIGLYKITK